VVVGRQLLADVLAELVAAQNSMNLGPARIEMAMAMIPAREDAFH
jgi:hypothetical protein